MCTDPSAIVQPAEVAARHVVVAHLGEKHRHNAYVRLGANRILTQNRPLWFPVRPMIDHTSFASPNARLPLTTKCTKPVLNVLPSVPGLQRSRIDVLGKSDRARSSACNPENKQKDQDEANTTSDYRA